MIPLLVATAIQKRVLLEEFRWFVAQAKSPRIRSMRRFAEEEIVIPDGPFKGSKFRCATQPYTRLFFEAFDSGQWRRIVVTGPTQSGKTLLAFVIVILYHLFELKENVIVGVPDVATMARDKWKVDILPVIMQSGYKALVPKDGEGSRGGKVTSITFRNGTTLRFMGAGGGDKTRSGYTARCVVMTEVDGFDTTGESSLETDKATQIENRTSAYGERATVVMECTVTIEEGRTWREIKAGSDSRIALLCPHCDGYVTPEREHLRGWQEAETEIEANKRAHFVCPDCAKPWSKDDRTSANLKAVLVHKGQVVTRGECGETTITGEPPQTETLGFRWSAVNNLFVSPGTLGLREWKKHTAPDEENAEKELCQFVWAIPYKSPLEALSTLTEHGVLRRAVPLGLGIVPEWTDYLTVAVDIGKYVSYYVAIAWSIIARCHVVDYDVIPIESDKLGEEVAIAMALRQFADRCLDEGWLTAGGEVRRPDQVWIDAGYKGQVVRQFCVEKAGSRPQQARFRPAVGRGAGQLTGRVYTHPKGKSGTVTHLGDGYHITRQSDKSRLVFVNSDRWKSFAHERLTVDAGADSAMTIFQGKRFEHTKFAKHLTAEKPCMDFKPEKGEFVTWTQVRRENHYLDAMYNACAAAHFCGVRVVGDAKHQANAAPAGWFAEQTQR